MLQVVLWRFACFEPSDHKTDQIAFTHILLACAGASTVDAGEELVHSELLTSIDLIFNYVAAASCLIFTV